MPTVVVLQRHAAVHATIPTELEATLASNVVAFVLVLVATSELAQAWARLPARRKRVDPSVVLVLLLLVLLPLALELILPLVARDAWMRPILTLAAESLAADARKSGHVIAVVKEDAFLAFQSGAVIDVLYVPREKFEQFVICHVGQAFLEDVDTLLRTQAVAAVLGGARQLVQSPLPHDDVEMILQTLEAEAVLTRQGATTLNLVLDEADRTLEHGPVLFTLALEFCNQPIVLFVHILYAFLGSSQIFDTNHPTQVSLAQYLRAPSDLGWTTYICQAPERENLFRPEGPQAR